MAERESEPKNDFPAPMISKRLDGSGSLNLDEVDMSKNGAQGDVAVSKGPAGALVTKLPDDGIRERI